jgi:signal peptidase
MKKVWMAIKSIFWVAIIVASVFIIFTTLNIGGYQMFVVKSGSMEPKIKTGSVVIDKTTNSYNTGDTITFKTSETTTVTHRVVKVDTKDGKTTYTVKGDANNSPDSNAVSSQNVVGKVWFSIPFLGYLIAFVRTLPGLIIFIIIPTIIIIADEMANIKTEAAKIKRAKRKLKEEAKNLEDVVIEEEKKIIDRINHKPSANKELIQ